MIPASSLPPAVQRVFVACYGVGWPEDGDAVLGVFSTAERAQVALDTAGVHGWIDECDIDTMQTVIRNV